MTRPIIDAHLDLAWNAVSFDRDLTLELEHMRALEKDMEDEPSRGHCTVSLPELKKARVPVCVATLLCRSGPDVSRPSPGFKRSALDYGAQHIAYAMAQGQLAYYQMLEQEGLVRIIKTREMLKDHWANWQENGVLGLIISMEGADPIVAPEHVAQWWEDGLRAVGPVHYGRSHYASGTGVDGLITRRGFALLREMEQVGMTLDVTHLCDSSMAQAFDYFEGPILASHHNCRTLVPGDRQLTDEQINILIEKGAVIGVALDAWMLYPGWKRGETDRTVVSLDAVADQIDHVCQIAGNASHSAIGSDLDGGFGFEQTPHDLDSIADLQKLNHLLDQRGYSSEDIDAIFFGNWLRFWENALPTE